jgi:hypothetical protein
MSDLRQQDSITLDVVVVIRPRERGDSASEFTTSRSDPESDVESAAAA